jgi:DUF1680 family protein
LANTGKVAIQRGPILFCAEGVDNSGHALDLMFPENKKFEAKFQPDLLHGITVLKGKGLFPSSNGPAKTNITLIPYYAWSHRDIGPMAVWLAE